MGRNQLKVFIAVSDDTQIGKSGTTLFASRTPTITSDIEKTVIVDLNFVNKNVATVYGYDGRESLESHVEGILPYRYYSIPSLNQSCVCVVDGSKLAPADQIVATLAHIAKEKQAVRMLVDTNSTLAHFTIPDLFVNYNWEVNYFFHWSFSQMGQMGCDLQRYTQDMTTHLSSVFHVVNLSSHWIKGDLAVPQDPSLLSWLTTFFATAKINRIFNMRRSDNIVASNQIIDILQQACKDSRGDLREGVDKMLDLLEGRQSLPLNLLIPPYSRALATDSGYKRWNPNVEDNMRKLDTILNNTPMQRYISQLNMIIR